MPVSIRLGLSLALAALPAAAHASSLDSFDPKAALGAAQGAEVPVAQGTLIQFTRHRFRVEARLCSAACLIQQPAVLTVEFEMEAAKDVNNSRLIRNLSYTLEVLPGGSIPDAPGATVRREAGPAFAYSEQSFKDGTHQFYIEASAPLGAVPRGSVLDDASDGKALLKAYPYCSPDLKTCRLGTIAGLDTYFVGSRIYPDHRLLSDGTFPLETIPL